MLSMHLRHRSPISVRLVAQGVCVDYTPVINWLAETVSVAGTSETDRMLVLSWFVNEFSLFEYPKESIENQLDDRVVFIISKGLLPTPEWYNSYGEQIFLAQNVYDVYG